jgi:hypothetical protein
MNTADRSIALIDAAMRRRCHFVPFFPHEGMKDLLRRWLADGNGRTAIADFLDAINKELLPLVGEHLLIGPSHFMRADLSENALRRCACRKPHPRNATRRYSLIRPPTRACLRTRYCSGSTGSGSGSSGAAACRERYGRC